jgi:hypothetical protein
MRATHRLKELLDTQNKRFQYMGIGHFHNAGTLDLMRGRLIINGSVVGGSDFATGGMFTTSNACQYLCGFHKDVGITGEWWINLQGEERNVTEGYKTVDLANQCMGELV